MRSASNASPLARSNAAVPVTAAIRCGRIPSVQPIAATTLARAPRDRPAERVISAPVPGIATMSSEVNRNAALTSCSLSGRPPLRAPQRLGGLLYDQCHERERRRAHPARDLPAAFLREGDPTRLESRHTVLKDVCS